ncbi:MAG: DUF2207 domain-containing protein [Anaerolineae bacterium]
MAKRLLVASALLLILALAVPGSVAAQDKSLVWDRYDVTLNVLANGDIDVEEVQTITFTGGSFTFGFRAIPLDRVERISHIRVYERQGDRLLEYSPSSSKNRYTFRTYLEDNKQVVYWYFPATKGAGHTYVIRYRVEGGLRIYDGGDQVWWKAIGADHNFPVTHSQVTVKLPASFRADQLTLASDGTAATGYVANGSTVIFAADNIKKGRELETRVQFPHGVIRADPPAWQAADDRFREAKAKYGPVLNVGLLFLGLALLFGGPVGVYALWYFRGRDEPAGVVAEYISEPPGDLSPGTAGTLVDEQADLQDILATLIDLARRGALRIEEENSPGFLGIGSGRDFIFHLQDSSVAVKPYEETLMQRIFGTREIRRMSDLRQKFYTALPELKQQFYTEVVGAGLFPRNPQTTRGIYMGLGIAALVMSIIIGVALFILTVQYSGLAICPSVAMIITAISLIIVGRHMPKKTRRGAEEAAKWLAFKRYLKNIAQYGNLEEAKSQFEKYLPYAIAFGVERRLMQQFSQVDTPAPTWYGPVMMGGPYHHGGGSAAPPIKKDFAPGPLAGEGKTPTLSDMSRGMGTSLQSMSAGLGAMLNSASRTFTSAPSSTISGGSGGSFSGGGFSGGGGGGGSAGFG